MQSTTVISRRTLDELESDLISRSSRINAEEYAFLCDVREFDLRQGWKAYHFNSCAEWLNFKCGIVPGTAREKVRVAQAMTFLPKVSQAFADGRLSYSKVRALTRIADAANEAELVDYALGSTALQVEAHCRTLRNARRDLSTPDAQRLYRERALTWFLSAEGRMTMHAEMPQEQGELVVKVLELIMSADEGDGVDGMPARRLDALVELARAYLAGGDSRPSSSADTHQVVVHVDEAALRERGGNSDLPLESVRRLLCDGRVVPVLEDGGGQPLNVGRKHRVVPPALRRALLARDRHCRYPGCTHTKWLHAHHVMHWVDGGETSIDNIVMLCSRHHRLLHEDGYRLRRGFDGGWCFVTPGGRLMAAVDRNASRDAPADQVFKVSEPRVMYVA